LPGLGPREHRDLERSIGDSPVAVGRPQRSLGGSHVAWAGGQSDDPRVGIARECEHVAGRPWPGFEVDVVPIGIGGVNGLLADRPLSHGHVRRGSEHRRMVGRIDRDAETLLVRERSVADRHDARGRTDVRGGRRERDLPLAVTGRLVGGRDVHVSRPGDLAERERVAVGICGVGELSPGLARAQGHR
jgi:hypothetical protein